MKIQPSSSPPTITGQRCARRSPPRARRRRRTDRDRARTGSRGRSPLCTMTIGEPSMTRRGDERERGSPSELAGEQVGAEHREAGPNAIATAGEPKRTSPTSRTSGQPSVYCEKNIPSCTPVSQGWKNGARRRRRCEDLPRRSASTVPQVDRLVAVPRVRGEHEMVHDDRDDHGEQHQRRDGQYFRVRVRHRRRPAARRRRRSVPRTLVGASGRAQPGIPARAMAGIYPDGVATTDSREYV